MQPNQVPTTPQLVPFDVSSNSPKAPSLHNTEPRHPPQETHFNCILIISFFQSLPKACEHRWGSEHKPTHIEFCITVWYNSPIQQPHYCWCCAIVPFNLTFHLTLTSEKRSQDIWPQQFTHNPKGTFHLFVAEHHGFRFWSAKSQPSCFTLSCKPPQCLMVDMMCWSKQNYKKAKSSCSVHMNKQQSESSPSK